MFIAENWEKYRPIVEGMREETKTPGIAEYFEYLYNELMKIPRADRRW
jgi:hypothetical protein